MRVLKLGGTSVGSVEAIRQATGIVARAVAQDRTLVVVSAFARITDELIVALAAARRGRRSWRRSLAAIADRHHRTLVEVAGGDLPVRRNVDERLGEIECLLEGVTLLGEATPPVADRVLACGERLSATVVAAALAAAGLEALAVDAAELIRTDDRFGEAEPDLSATRPRVRRWMQTLAETTVPVVTGFIGADRHGRTTTLGRGGSDLSAAVLAAAVEADRLEIWTDVCGVLSGPPRLLAGVRSLPFLSYDEAGELAFFGAKVLHRRTLEPVAGLGIPVAIRNTHEPDHPGTVVGPAVAGPPRARALACLAPVSLLTTPIAAAAPLLSHAILMTQASADRRVAVVVPVEHASALTATADTLARRDDLAVIAVVGHGLAGQPWIAGRTLEVLGRRGVAVHLAAAGATRHSFVLLVDAREKERTLATLHEALMLGRDERPTDLRRPAVAMEHHHEGNEDPHRHPRRDRRRRPEARLPAA